MSSNHFHNTHQAQLPAVHHSSLTQQYGHAASGPSYATSQPYAQMGLFGNPNHSSNHNMNAASAMGSTLSNSGVPPLMNGTVGTTSTMMNNINNSHNSVSGSGHHYMHRQHQSQNHLQHLGQQQHQQQGSHHYSQSSQQSHLTQIQQSAHPSQQQIVNQQYPYHVPQQNHIPRGSSNINNHGMQSLSAIPPPMSMAAGTAMSLNNAAASALSPVSNSLAMTSKPASAISKRSRKPRSKATLRVSSGLEMDPNNAIFDTQSTVAAHLTNHHDAFSTRLLQQFQSSAQMQSFSQINPQTQSSQPHQRQLPYQQEPRQIHRFQHQPQGHTNQVSSQHQQPSPTQHAGGPSSHPLYNSQFSQPHLPPNMMQGTAVPYQQQHILNQVPAHTSVQSHQGFQQQVSLSQQQHMGGTMPASSTGPAYECDGIQFKLLEDLADVKVKRLRSEKIKPIEELTFDDIKAYNRNQLRAYCFVYGIKRKKKAEMEQNMARYAAMFHHGDPAFDTSMFVPTDYLPGPIPRRKVPVTKEQKALSAGKFAARYLPTQRARPSVSGSQAFAASISPPNSSAHYSGLHGAHIGSSGHQGGLPISHHSTHPQHASSHGHHPQHDAHEALNGFHAESNVLVPPHNMLGDMGEE